METLSLIGFFLALLGGINAVWILIWYLLALSGRAGIHLSKKLGTDNENTDHYAKTGKTLEKDLLKKLIWRLGITAVGYILYVLS